jgi:hypothetical protein
MNTRKWQALIEKISWLAIIRVRKVRHIHPSHGVEVKAINNVAVHILHGSTRIRRLYIVDRI